MAQFPLQQFKDAETPFYYYDLQLLEQTLNEVKAQTYGFPFHVHYAVKANANPGILRVIHDAGIGVDCVSGGEISASIDAGFAGSQIAFAGVGKTDKEINLALDADIFCFNVESLPELEVINDLAAKKGKVAKVAIRVNPNIDAHTHKYITTGLSENKFGINLELLDGVVDEAMKLEHINLCGLHFHIGSQIMTMEPFQMLCGKINKLQNHFEKKGVKFDVINVGGGLGIDYDNPDANPIASFKDYFDTFKFYLELREGQQLHFELGRSIVAQCGALITRVTYVKKGSVKQYAIVDAGMTDLIRPVLYQAHHNVENITSDSEQIEKYDVVGPICESSDVFATDEPLKTTSRGDLLALRSAGAYGEIMASHYNCRPLPGSLFSK
ncbi:MAG: diaminopimelate decarboxylase [Muribaculaceae bacterium]|jgi:diaminopimelate decarboxylase|nr:diaminopimelate decarboxylase [Muribaculaceae bacterium]